MKSLRWGRGSGERQKKREREMFKQASLCSNFEK